MKKTYLLLIISLLLGSVNAQEKLDINFDSIKTVILKGNTYKELLNRYEANDSTLTKKDYSILYYGQLFRKSYSLGADNRSVKIKTYLKSKEYDKAYDLCKKALDDNPVSLEALCNIITSGSELKKPQEELNKYTDKYWKILKLIASTGDGKSENSGFKVICVNDEYQLMYSYFNVDGITSQSLVGSCDLIEFKSSKYFNGNKMYFDVSQVLLKEQELFSK